MKFLLKIFIKFHICIIIPDIIATFAVIVKRESFFIKTSLISEEKYPTHMEVKYSDGISLINKIAFPLNLNGSSKSRIMSV